MIYENSHGRFQAARRTSLRAASTLALLLVIAAGLTAGAISHATPAFACTISNDCHSQIEDDMGHNNGVSGGIYFTCLHSPNSTDFVTNEMWDDTSSDGSAWIETGVIDGFASKTRSWFWADVTPTTPFNVYFPSGFAEAAYSTVYNAEIQYASPQTWLIYGADSDFNWATVHNEPNNTSLSTAGSEFSDQTGLRDSGQIQGMEWEDSSSVWHFFGSSHVRPPEQYGPNNQITPSYDSGTSTVSWSDC